ncbi:MAG: hypothetical protein HY898_01490 [Deltaproteobacteria bacterium]|nr:hypothetical protein [Deltaproteobacteria bacterium]
MFRKRAQASDHVLRVRVTSFLTQRGLDGPVHRLQVVPIGDPIAGPRPSDTAFDLQIPQSNPFFQVMAAMGQQIVQRTFVAYLKRFSGPIGPELHWFMTSESPEVIQAVREVHLLMEVRASNP